MIRELRIHYFVEPYPRLAAEARTAMNEMGSSLALDFPVSRLSTNRKREERAMRPIRN